ncbi:hypothetical protein P7C70_g950, partial [Phenoliferia sp. Uapishka_3]
MSYATNLAQVDPVNGLFGAAIPAMVYSVLGTCRQLSVGPEAALSLITGQAITAFIAEETHAHGEMTAAQKMKLAMMISTALLRGFITAVGLVIFIGQAIPILGLEQALAATSPPAESMVEKIGFILENLGQTHILTLAVSLGALAVLVLAKMFKGRLMSRRGFTWLAYVPEYASSRSFRPAV